MNAFFADQDLRKMSRCVELPSCLIYAVSPTLWWIFQKSGPEKNMSKVFRWSAGTEPPPENNSKKNNKNCFFFSSIELNPELLTTECTVQKQRAIKLSQKVAQSTSISTDKYRFNSILTKNSDGLRMQGAFWDLYLHYWKVFRKKWNDFFWPSLIEIGVFPRVSRVIISSLFFLYSIFHYRVVRLCQSFSLGRKLSKKVWLYARLIGRHRLSRGLDCLGVPFRKEIQKEYTKRPRPTQPHTGWERSFFSFF